MIEVKWELTGNSFSAEVNGHAGHDEKGRDIVCAAVSALTQTAGVCFEEMFLSGEAESFEALIENGHTSLYVRGKGRKSRKMRHYAEMLINGLSLIESKYPEAVRLVG